MNSARSFRSIFMVASCAAAALGCYMVSLRVASERAALEDVENQIVLAQRDMRVLQTEIGTRGRLAQLERWNVRVLALSAPSADQFLNGGFELAKLARPADKLQIEAPVVLASAPAPDEQKAPIGQPDVRDDGEPAAAPAELLHTASLKLPEREVIAPARPAAEKPAAKQAKLELPQPARPLKSKPEPKQAAAAKQPDKKSTEKSAAHASAKVTQPAKLAKADPLAPLPDSKNRKAHKDTVSAR